MTDEVAYWESEALKDPGNADKMRRLTESFKKANWTYRDKTIEQWVAQLRGANWREASEAYRALIKIGIGAVPALIKVLDDATPGARSYSARALGKIGPSSQLAVVKLCQILTDPDWRVRYAAACSLGEIGFNARDAVEFMQSLRESEAKVREAITTSVAQIKQAQNAQSGGLLDTSLEDQQSGLADRINRQTER